MEAYVEVAVGGYAVQSGKVSVEVSKEVASQEVTVGEATGTNSNTPLALNWKLSQSQTIYTADKLGIAAGSEIVSLGYDGYCSADKDVTFHIKVWMMNTSATTVSTDAPVDPATMTLVYEGDHQIAPQGSSSELVRLLDLPFNESFVYDGTNLCVMVESTSDNYKAVNFANESAVANVSMYRRHDVELPATWTTAGMPVANFGTSREVPTISGKVTEGSTGEAVAATIELVSGDVLYKTETDAEGNYSMEIFQADKEYTMTVSAEGYEAVTETVAFAEGSVVKDVVLSRNVKILSGVVTDSKTDAPLAGVCVKLFDNISEEFEMTTTETGIFSFEVIDNSKEYTLTASLDGYGTYEKTGITFDEGNMVIDIALEKVSGVGAVTVDGLYVKGVNNAIEVVAPGKTIVSVYDLGGRLIRSVEVNEGKTLIEGLVEGIYLVNRVKVYVK